MADNLYDVAREVTDEVLGKGTYAEINRGNPDPGVQATIKKADVMAEVKQPKAPWRAKRNPQQPWYIRRVRFFDDQGRRNTTFKTRWWVKPFVEDRSALTGPYFERKLDVRRWWFDPLNRPK